MFVMAFVLGLVACRALNLRPRSCATLLAGAKQIEQQNEKVAGKKVALVNQDSGLRFDAGDEEESEVAPSFLACSSIHPLPCFFYFFRACSCFPSAAAQAQCKPAWTGPG